MPTYEYACQSCAHEFEQFQTMSAAPLKVCPQCGKKQLKRLVGGGAGLIFKGSGFYITDYKKKTGGEPKATETKSSPGETKAASSETKAASRDAKTSSPSSTPAKPATSAAKK
jgi:putative FmdB family regulatory protein